MDIDRKSSKMIELRCLREHLLQVIFLPNGALLDVITTSLHIKFYPIFSLVLLTTDHVVPKNVEQKERNKK